MRRRRAWVMAASCLAACTPNIHLEPDGGGQPSGAGGSGHGGSAGAAGGHGGSTGGGGSGAAGHGGGADAGGPQPTVIEFQQTVNRNVDILFMLDDSSNMTPLQNKLTAAFPTFVDTLKMLAGGLPNLHLAVVSSSMGAGRNPSLDHCPQGGDQGIFHTKPLGATCAKAVLAPGQTFIANIDGMANYTGELADMFGCIAPLGDGGCGFEHQFESVLRALGADGAAAPPQNTGFLRPDAYLQVVLMTDEDDCSAPPNSDLFDSSSMTLTDPLGPLQSYRCNEFGHLCGGKRPPRTPAGPTDLSGTCASAEDGRLLRVADVVTALKRLKADPARVFVSAIAAPTSPYVVNTGPSQMPGNQEMWPYVQHSCMSADGTVGDPAVRIAQWANAFGANGLFEEICSDTFAPALQAIAMQVGKAISAMPCLPATVTPSHCTLVDHFFTATGQIADVPLPACDASAAGASCWSTTTSALCARGALVQFTRPPGTPAPEATTATCQN
jgi:hypothetical protein